MTSCLFQPIQLGSLSLPNRLVRSATWEGMADADGRPTSALCEFYRRLVEGGSGLLISGYVAVHPLALQNPGTLRLDREDFAAALAPLPAAVHAAGGRVLAQLFHGGGQTGPRALGRPGLAPSAIAFPSYDGVPQELTEAEITGLVQDFAAAARRARESGFDGVQLHAAHGYLLHQFLSPLTNRRTDAWGGPLENRARFLREIVAAVRGQAGADFPLLVKLNATDNLPLLPHNFSVEEATMLGRWLETDGVCGIEVSAGFPASGPLGPARTGVLAGQGEAYNAGAARSLRQSVNLPILCVGGIRSRAQAETLLTDGTADLVALSRPLIREPDLPRRWREGDRRSATCLSCNGCFRPGLKDGGIRCIQDDAPSCR